MRQRPKYLKQEHLDFLDRLRESGQTNMFGARPYLVEEFLLSEEEAIQILMYWMETFDLEDR